MSLVDNHLNFIHCRLHSHLKKFPETPQILKLFLQTCCHITVGWDWTGRGWASLENTKQTSVGYGGWVGMWATEVSFPEELSEIFNNSVEVGTRVNIAGARSPTERKMIARFEKYLLAKLGNKSSERYNHISLACRHLFTQTSSGWCDSPRYSINE